MAWNLRAQGQESGDQAGGKVRDAMQKLYVDLQAVGLQVTRFDFSGDGMGPIETPGLRNPEQVAAGTVQPQPAQPQPAAPTPPAPKQPASPQPQPTQQRRSR